MTLVGKVTPARSWPLQGLQKCLVQLIAQDTVRDFLHMPILSVLNIMCVCIDCACCMQALVRQMAPVLVIGVGLARTVP